MILITIPVITHKVTIISISILWKAGHQIMIFVKIMFLLLANSCIGSAPNRHRSRICYDRKWLVRILVFSVCDTFFLKLHSSESQTSLLSFTKTKLFLIASPGFSEKSFVKASTSLLHSSSISSPFWPRTTRAGSVVHVRWWRLYKSQVRKKGFAFHVKKIRDTRLSTNISARRYFTNTSTRKSHNEVKNGVPVMSLPWTRRKVLMLFTLSTNVLQNNYM